MNIQLLNRLRPFIGFLLMATIVLYYAGLHWGLQSLGFGILFPLTFVITLAIDKSASIFQRQEMLLFLLFLIFSFVAVFYPNIDFEKFNFTITKILAAFMGAYIGIGLCNKLDLEDYFHIAYILVLILIIFAEYSLGTFNPVTFYAPSAARSDFLYNANYYSYIALFANFSVFRLHLKYRNTWTLGGLIVIPILAIAISFTTQSRSGLIFIILINALFWFWVNKTKIRNPIYAIFRKVLMFLISLAFVLQFINIYTNSSIENRMSSTSNEESRGQLIKRGIEVFLDHPITGVGAGNFINYSPTRHMTHNNYTEALVEHGFFIGLLIIAVFFLPFFKSFRLYLTNKSNPEYKLSLLFFFIFLLFNNIYVFYRASNSMMFFFLMIGIHYKLLETKNQE
ncbi:O-antigen ligase family protein [Maribacter sp. ANRC-HE7]|uniref:O-antigen ligase family protein n=1 Tax=Maribacter aquimaris TaxID=2737171 RepID=A0ABR7V6A1_9FLAO|nr:O-antigen ligase family protein [Maribacter aquimaris]MBD0778836.1 O-antigen ligase family protein [Maribacter aquimaris]